ncbi:MAG TPA: class I SAM-dependent methyltransferase [Usitatibacter sp.]|nr:class I SAM-dependent methyltransferase [Usitatibacter sp.]
MRLNEGRTRSEPRGAPADEEALRAIASLELDAVLAGARAGRIEEALSRIVASLAQVRARSSPEAWTRVLAAARAHPLRGFLHLDPFVLRCYAQPRGIAGDARALDFALRGRPLEMPLADAAAALHRCVIRGQTARALRYRRDALARAIEEAIANASRPPAIFAAGCGHLREWDRIVGFGAPSVGRIVAFDGDADNLEQVKRDYASLPISTHLGSVRDLVRGGELFGDMDLVYCSGLLEILPQPSAAALARALFGMLRRGGTLVLTQFLVGLGEAAFVEAFMDWRMVYRTRAELVALAQDLLPDSERAWDYAESPESTLGVLTLRRR